METEELKKIAKTIYEEDECEIKGRLTNYQLKEIREYIIQLKEEGGIDG